MKLSVVILAAILCAAGCGGASGGSYDDPYESSSYETTSDYLSLQEAWDGTSLDDKVNVCTNIEADPSIVGSTASDSGIDPDVSEQFFSDVCP